MKPSDLTAKDRARFESKYTRGTLDECWPWNGTVASNGYGLFGFGGRMGRTVGAHRIAWMLANDAEVPDRYKSHMCHRCDNPSCVNPSHLFLGSSSDNLKDAVRKGYQPITLRGSANAKAKLTDEQVRQIRQLCDAGIEQRDVAANFGISQTTVWNIWHRITWNHVE